MTPRATGPIALFLPSVRGGGAQRVVVNLAQGMSERGLSVDLVLTAAVGVFLDQLPPAVRLIDLGAGRLVRSVGPLGQSVETTRVPAASASIRTVGSPSHAEESTKSAEPAM
jgi:hypothetical protein